MFSLSQNFFYTLANFLLSFGAMRNPKMKRNFIIESIVKVGEFTHSICNLLSLYVVIILDVIF